MISLHVAELRDGAGPPVVVLHGLAGSSRDFEELVAAPEFPERRVVGVDLPCHGASGDFDGEFDFPDVVDAVLGSVDSVVEGAFDLVGYELGGRVALYLTGTRPDRVRSVAVIAAHPGIEHPGERREQLELDAARASLLVEAGEIFIDEWFLRDELGPRRSNGWEAQRARAQEQASSSAFGWSRILSSLSLGRQVMLWNVPYATEITALYVAGGLDDRSIALGREFVAQNPRHARLAVIGNAHGAPHLDRPGVVARELSRFWSEQ